MYVPLPSHEKHSFEQCKVLMPWTCSSTFVEDSVTLSRCKSQSCELAIPADCFNPSKIAQENS
eukprot:6027912-Karenia_brevis.AAC.1